MSPPPAAPTPDSTNPPAADLTNDDALEWMHLYEAQKRRCDEEGALLRSIKKRAVAAGMNPRALTNVSRIMMKQVDSEIVIADRAAEAHLLALRKVPITRESLFDGWDLRVTEKTQRIDDIWDAEDKGYRAGRHGADISECPYDPGTELSVAWTAEWHKGQASIARELGPEGGKQADAGKARPKRTRQVSIPGTEPLVRAKPTRKRNAASRASNIAAESNPSIN